MKWAIGLSFLAFAGCSNAGDDSPCDVVDAIAGSGNGEHELVRFISSEENLCVQLLQSNDTDSTTLLQFQFDQEGRTMKQQSLTFLFWSEDDNREKYWAYANTVDYVIEENSAGDYQFSAYNAQDSRLLSGPILLTRD